MSSPVIPKEKLSAYQRWELHAFDAPNESMQSPGARRQAEEDKVRHLHQHAYEAGRADALRETTAKHSAEAEHLKTLLLAIECERKAVEQRLAGDVVELALEIAQQIVHQALAVKPELIIPLVHEAITRTAEPAGAASLVLNPADATLVREKLGDELTTAGWRVVEDPAIQRGGLRIQTPATQVDATIATRWKRLAAALGANNEWIASER